MQMPDCAPEFDEQGILVWRGLRVRIGMSWGMITSQKALNTGRADYFGVLANGAARVSALAAPGQVGRLSVCRAARYSMRAASLL